MKALSIFKHNSTLWHLIVVTVFSVGLVKINATNSNAHQEFIEAGFIDKDSLVEFAKSLKGTKYCYGSCKPGSGFDCSGFVYYVFSQFGMTLPRSSYLMAEVGEEVKLKNCKKGDLLFFTGIDSKIRTVGHVGIVVSEKGQPVEFIHCSSGKSNSVVITSMSSPHYQKRFLKVKRIE